MASCLFATIVRSCAVLLKKPARVRQPTAADCGRGRPSFQSDRAQEVRNTSPSTDLILGHHSHDTRTPVHRYEALVTASGRRSTLRTVRQARPTTSIEAQPMDATITTNNTNTQRATSWSTNLTRQRSRSLHIYRLGTPLRKPIVCQASAGWKRRRCAHPAQKRRCRGHENWHQGGLCYACVALSPLNIAHGARRNPPCDGISTVPTV